MSVLPDQYLWLKKEKGPIHLLEALKHYGLREIKGAQHNPVILHWAKELNPAVARWYKKDEDPWCGVFAGICLKRAGWVIPKSYDALRALKYAEFGKTITPDQDYCVGDIATFTRAGGGHVGFLVGEDHECFHVLGGNQSDAVNITRIKSDRLYSVSRPPYKYFKPSLLPRLRPSGVISQNEA